MSDYIANVLYGMADVLQIMIMIPMWGIFIVVLIWQVSRIYDLWRFYHGKSSAFGDGTGKGKNNEVHPAEDQ